MYGCEIWTNETTRNGERDTPGSVFPLDEPSVHECHYPRQYRDYYTIVAEMNKPRLWAETKSHPPQNSGRKQWSPYHSDQSTCSWIVLLHKGGRENGHMVLIYKSWAKLQLLYISRQLWLLSGVEPVLPRMYRVWMELSPEVVSLSDYLDVGATSRGTRSYGLHATKTGGSMYERAGNSYFHWCSEIFWSGYKFCLKICSTLATKCLCAVEGYNRRYRVDLRGLIIMS